MARFSFSSATVRQYHRYRKIGTELNHKIIESHVNEAIIEIAARTLGLGKNRQLILDSEDDLSVLMDFSLYEIRNKQGKNLVEQYQEEKGGSNHVERDLLAAMVKANTGLFKVEGIAKDRYLLKLASLINKGQNITLMDINFSQTMPNGLILFFRPIQLAEFTMTSGIAFVFPSDVEQEMCRRWQKLETGGVSNRYARFFKLSKSKGLATMYM